jgi:hypothetical protein
MRVPRSLIILGTALIFLLGGFAVANALPSPATINACVQKSTGTVRVPTSGSCAKTETALSWNQQGQDGAPGADGVSGYEVVTKDFDLQSGVVTFGSEAAHCPTGKRVLGGGYTPIDPASGIELHTTALQIDSSYPTADGTGWTLNFSADTEGTDYDLRIRITCAVMAA